MTETHDTPETSSALFPTTPGALAKRSPIACVKALKSLLPATQKRILRPNELLKIARLLLSFASACRGTDAPVREAKLQERLVEAVHQFMARAKAADYEHADIMAARYLLCALLDELITASEWKIASQWRQDGGLLAVFAQEPAASGQFFQILKRCCEQPQQHFDLLELGYYCLSAGFMGEYRGQAGGLQSIAQMRDQLYQIIVHYRGEVPFDLQLGEHPFIPRRSSWAAKFFRARAMGVVWMMVAVSIGVLFIPYEQHLQHLSHTVLSQPQPIVLPAETTRVVTPVAAPVSIPVSKPLQTVLQSQPIPAKQPVQQGQPNIDERQALQQRLMNALSQRQVTSSQPMQMLLSGQVNKTMQEK